MLQYVSSAVQAAENSPDITDRKSALVALRAIGLDDFGQFLINLCAERQA